MGGKDHRSCMIGDGAKADLKSWRERLDGDAFAVDAQHLGEPRPIGSGDLDPISQMDVPGQAAKAKGFGRHLRYPASDTDESKFVGGGGNVIGEIRKTGGFCHETCPSRLMASCIDCSDLVEAAVTCSKARVTSMRRVISSTGLTLASST